MTMTFDEAIKARGIKPKKYRNDVFRTERARYCGTSTRRLTDKQIVAAAERFQADGEIDNAHNMLSLIEVTS